MSVNINWSSLNNDYVATFLTRAINFMILQNKHLLIGGFAYVDELQLGETKPTFEFVSVDVMTTNHIVGEVKFGYNSQLFIKAQAYAPINPLQSSSKFAKRSRLHMNLAESAAPGYINAWACIQNLHIEGSARIEYKTFSEIEIQNYIAEKYMNLDPNTDPSTLSIPKGLITITLNSFPIKSVQVSFSFDGSVIAEMVSTTVNQKIKEVDQLLQQQDYTFTVPI